MEAESDKYDGMERLMRYRIMLMLLVILMGLTACDAIGGGEEEPEPTPAPQEPEPSDTPAAEIIVTRRATQPGELPVPGVGTLVASETEDPNADLIFDTITLVRTPTGEDPQEEPFTLVINRDGNYTRDGVDGVISQATVTEIDNMLDALNFFGLQATFMGPSTEMATYVYRLTVVRGEEQRTITSMDGYMPQPYQSLVATIFEVGLRPAGF